MNTSLNQIPQSKKEELTKIAQLVSSFKEVEMVILFGSYARGNWVEDKYVEKGVTYEYRSDYDLLVVLKHEDLKQKFRIEGEVKTKLIETGEVTTPVSIIFHGIKYLNEALTIGNYFFKDIKKEGIVLYDSEKVKLAVPKELTAKEYQNKAQSYFDQWFKSADMFFVDFESNFNRGEKDKDYYSKAAFELHQATERYYTTILLVFTDYRPKDHHLETLGIKAEMCDKQFAVFTQTTDEEKRLFELLKKAYIDARYKMDEYGITKEELQYLSHRVSDLKRLTAEICKQKIKQIGEAD
jgi:predicted nucleotidyltransferase/HEPN domain-containing protein